MSGGRDGLWYDRGKGGLHPKRALELISGAFEL